MTASPAAPPSEMQKRLLSRLLPLRVSIDDTGGEFSGWPSIVACEEADLSVIHRAGFKQEYWGDLSQRDAVLMAEIIVSAVHAWNAALAAQPPEPQPQLTMCNPAPDGSPPQMPTGAHATIEYSYGERDTVNLAAVAAQAEISGVKRAPGAPHQDIASVPPQPGDAEEADVVPLDQCPSCYWHPGHDPDEWFREEAAIRGLVPAAQPPQPGDAEITCPQCGQPPDKVIGKCDCKFTAGLKAARSKAPQPGDAERLARIRRDDRFNEEDPARSNYSWTFADVAFLLRLLDAAQSALADRSKWFQACSQELHEMRQALRLAQECEAAFHDEARQAQSALSRIAIERDAAQSALAEAETECAGYRLAYEDAQSALAAQPPEPAPQPEMIPPECYPGCDDPSCPYTHTWTKAEIAPPQPALPGTPPHLGDAERRSKIALMLMRAVGNETDLHKDCGWLLTKWIDATHDLKAAQSALAVKTADCEWAAKRIAQLDKENQRFMQEVAAAQSALAEAYARYTKDHQDLVTVMYRERDALKSAITELDALFTGAAMELDEARAELAESQQVAKMRRNDWLATSERLAESRAEIEDWRGRLATQCGETLAARYERDQSRAEVARLQTKITAMESFLASAESVIECAERQGAEKEAGRLRSPTATGEDASANGAVLARVSDWKHEWLDLAASLDRLMIRANDHKDRVRELIIQYANVLRSLLYADVNGGLEEEYADFPDAPMPDGTCAAQPDTDEGLANLQRSPMATGENREDARRIIRDWRQSGESYDMLSDRILPVKLAAAHAQGVREERELTAPIRDAAQLLIEAIDGVRTDSRERLDALRRVLAAPEPQP